ncbi:Eco57I restriction-modification methylase domain-containing protein [Loigolactobacillus coryniformis]|uniref:Eco57I restriction-modification methylase domain-containing protein n=1 Tax=Loigolactobacillus coryniformis TaxID=1610 RepID=UPI003F251C7C
MMKFDVVVGNPPYQESRDNTHDDAIYNYFYDLAEKMGSKYCLISPARFLFNAGSTDKKWNKKMLDDKHLKVEFYEHKSTKVFPNTDIKGGVAILYRDSSKYFGKIGTFTSFDELNTIVHKVMQSTNATLDIIMSGQGIYKFTPKMHNEHPEVRGILSKSHPNDVGTGVLETLHNILFFKDNPNDGNEYIQILGRYKNERVYHWCRRDYINEPYAYDKYRVVLSKASGTGAFGEALSVPLIVKPNVGFNQTFISIGSFTNELEAKNCLKYVKSKFSRTMLNVLKITQDNPKDKWKKVPLQDFTATSDIDWSKSIPEIDQQLYIKYGLSTSEIKFIEEKVKPMD